MKHLILGSKGQVGTYVADVAKKLGHEVIEYDIVMGKQFDLANTDNGAELERLVAASDFVHFLAYDVGGSTYLAKYQDSYDFVNNNVKIMQNTFQILKRTNKPFYFASSQMSNMYKSVYGRLKAVGEAYTAALPNGYNIQFWNVYGYETDPEKTHVITDFIRMALKENRILIRTTGMEERNFLYGEDAAHMLLNLSNAIMGGNPDDTIALQSGLVRWKGVIPIHGGHYNTRTIREVARMISLAIDGDFEMPIYTTDKADSIQSRLNDVPDYTSWQESLLLKGRGITSLQDGIKNLVEIERKNAAQ